MFKNKTLFALLLGVMMWTGLVASVQSQAAVTRNVPLHEDAMRLQPAQGTDTIYLPSILHPGNVGSLRFTGYAQKGPFIQGAQVTIRKLDPDLGPTGLSYASLITDNRGYFSVPGNLVAPLVELSATGFYFNEISGDLSNAPINLNAIADTRSTPSINLNVMTHLEEPRVRHLVDQGLSFSQAQAQAQQELLAAFNITSVNLPKSETLNMSQEGTGNAILLALSALLQGERSEAELTELLANLREDLRADGLLSNPALEQTLLNTTEDLKPRRAAIRTHIENRYTALGEPAEIPQFENYLYLLDQISPTVTSTWPTPQMVAEVDSITVVFDDWMLPDTVVDSIQLQSENGAFIGGQIEVVVDSAATYTGAAKLDTASVGTAEGPTVAIFTPNQPLAAGSYTLTVSSTAQDYGFNPLAHAVVFPFTHAPISQIVAANSGPTRLGEATLLTATVPGAHPAIEYTWSLGETTQAGGPTPSHIYPAAGQFTATVTALLNGESHTATTIVTVIDQPITGVAIDHAAPIRIHTSTPFTGSVATGTNITYAWDFGDGATASGAQASHAYTALGDYTVTLTATNSVSQEVATQPVTVIDRPIVGLQASYNGVAHVGTPTNFIATIDDGSTVTYTWDFGDGSSAAGAQVSHIYTATGSYTARVTATNSIDLVTIALAVEVDAIASIDGRSTHTCVSTVLGNAACWGNREYGQTGDGDPEYREWFDNPNLTPVKVVNLNNNVASVAAGSGHSCAVTRAGGIKCWGNYEFGQLGDGTMTGSRPAGTSSPVAVTGLDSGVSMVSTGRNHTCAVTTVGALKCWGENADGELGDGSRASPGIPVPVDVVGLDSGVTAAALGGAFSCALTDAGGVKCWGSNYRGQLGDGTDSDKLTPTDVTGLDSGVTAITAGTIHACALLDTGEVKCWGGNQDGQIGDGTMNNGMTPQDVIGLDSDVVAIAAGTRHTCALLDTGAVQCWGLNTDGQVGDGTTEDRLAPVQVTGLGGPVASITAGGAHTCAILTTGATQCWGNNQYGQLGNGTRTNSLVPVNVVWSAPPQD